MTRTRLAHSLRSIQSPNGISERIPQRRCGKPAQVAEPPDFSSIHHHPAYAMTEHDKDAAGS